MVELKLVIVLSLSLSFKFFQLSFLLIVQPLFPNDIPLQIVFLKHKFKLGMMLWKCQLLSPP